MLLGLLKTKEKTANIAVAGRFIPVSYTHLDVYKRQDLLDKKWIPHLIHPNEKQGEGSQQREADGAIVGNRQLCWWQHLNSKYNEASEKIGIRGLDTVCHHKIRYRILDQLINRERIFMRFFFFYFKQRRAGTGVSVSYTHLDVYKRQSLCCLDTIQWRRICCGKILRKKKLGILIIWWMWLTGKRM